MKNFFSIRAKFLSVMGLLLVACLVVYLLIAVTVFKTDKTELVFDLNRSMVSNLSAEVETELIGVADKFKVFALLSTAKDFEHSLNETLFNDRSDVVFVSLYRQDQTNVPLKKFLNQTYLETYGIEKTYFEEAVPAKRPIPFNDIIKNGEHVWNASVENGVALIGYGRSVLIENHQGIPTDHLMVVGYLKPDKVIKALNSVKLSEVQVVDSSGNLLVHSDFDMLTKNQNLSDDLLFKKASESKVGLSVVSITQDDREYLAAFAKSYQGKIFVLAKASKDQAFSVVYQLVSRSLSFALIVITLSILFAVLLSRSLTRPISVLVEGMHKVSEGDLHTQIEVKTNDETRMLASSFNKMISDLKQSRDELETINRELDQKVKERTRQLEIQNKAVKEAQEALLKTTRLASAGEIAGRAAHEVLNPLTGMLTRLGALEKRLQNGVQPQLTLMKDIFANWNTDYSSGGFEKLVDVWKQQSQIDSALNLWTEDMHNITIVQSTFESLVKSVDDDTQFLLSESRRISKIINSMRKLSRLQSDVHVYSTKNLLVDCRNIMADMFNYHGIEFVENFSDGTDEINIDRDEFIQITTNLMRNSVQALIENKSQAKRFLKVITKLESERIVIDFIDNGCGISNEYQPLLFEKQFSTKSADDGTGLGLSISRRLIRAHGGDLQFVSSIPNKETIFRVIIPLRSQKSSDITEGAA